MDELKIGSILYPTDFSSSASIALPHARALAKQLQVPLHVIYIAPDLGTRANEDVLNGRLTRFLEDHDLKEFLELAQVRYGDPVQEILTVAREVFADIIVMGTHGQTALESVFLGSVTQDVMKKAPCPVYVVRNEF